MQQTEAPLQPQQPQQQQAVQPQTQDLTKTVQPKLKPLVPTDDRQAPSGGAPIDVAPPPGLCRHGSALTTRTSSSRTPEPEQWILHVAVAAAATAGKWQRNGNGF